jgi:hypothetical protein
MADPVGSLADPFNVTSLNTALWTQTTGGTTTMAYATTGASINLPASATASDGARLVSNATYDFTGSNTTLHTVSMVSDTTSAGGEFGLSPVSSLSSTDHLRWVKEGFSLYAQERLASVVTTVATLTYSISTHAYWRISENAGVATWWTSADGISWTSQGTRTHGMTITAVGVIVQAYCYQVETSPGTFKFNLLNSGRIASRSFIQQQAVNRSYTY